MVKKKVLPSIITFEDLSPDQIAALPPLSIGNYRWMFEDARRDLVRAWIGKDNATNFEILHGNGLLAILPAFSLSRSKDDRQVKAFQERPGRIEEWKCDRYPVEYSLPHLEAWFSYAKSLVRALREPPYVNYPEASRLGESLIKDANLLTKRVAALAGIELPVPKPNDNCVAILDQGIHEIRERFGTKSSPIGVGGDSSPAGHGPNGWSRPDSPSRWATTFGMGFTTFKRRVKDGKIRAKQLSTKSYQVAVDDIPADKRAKYLPAK